MNALIVSAACILACKFFAVLFKAPARVQWIAAVIGGGAYMLSVALDGVSGAFAGALLLTLCGEAAARRLKVTASSIVTVALVPLVPGVGMYETMLLLVQGDPGGALMKGITTIATAGAIAGAVALGASAMRLVTRFVSQNK